MFRFGKLWLFALLMLSSALPARGQVQIQPAELDVAPRHFRVSVNGIDVSNDSLAYLGNDGTVFASATDLAAWKLRYPEDPAFVRAGKKYYGLQTQLKVAVGIQRPPERLRIIALSTAFLGGPEREEVSLEPGGGAFLNYKLDYRGATAHSLAETTGNYNLFFTHNASALRIDYHSLQTGSGIAFARQSTTLTTVDFRKHRVASLGEQHMDAGDLGTNPEFVGLHLSSNYDVDPHFITHALPSVQGFATQPSMVEAYVDNTLQWRQEVPEGPFTVRNLPPSAAHSDVTIVLTDQSGRRTTEIVRPSVEQGLAPAGITQYIFDVGLAETEPATFGFDEPHATSSLAASALLRRGVTSWLTLQGMAETIGPDPFAGVGAELRPFVGNATFWFGNGKLRRDARFLYTFSTDRLSFSEKLQYNAQNKNDPFEPNGLFSRVQEEGELQYSPSDKLRFGLKLDRNVTSDGSAQSLLTFISTVGLGHFDLTVEPMYVKERNAVDFRVQLGQRVGETHRITETANQPASQPLSGSIGYQRSPQDANDRWRFGANLNTGRSLARTAFIESQMPWTEAKANGQDTAGLGGNLSAEVEGAFGLVYGAGPQAMRDKYQENTIGVVRIPGFAGVRIEVNDALAGYTNANGTVVVQQLSALQGNIIAADISGIPLGVDVRDPVVVVPLPATPVSVDMLSPQAQSVILRVVDASGHPLAPATWLIAEDGTRFPIGFDGRTYIHGLRSGAHILHADAPQRCAVQLTLERRWQLIEAQKKTCQSR